MDKTVYRSLANIPKGYRIKLINAIDELSENPEIGKQLRGNFKALRTIRVGNYRVVY
ncbi:type II toxin-antitoxin system RelE family toxin [Candidatus Magnetobacterium casense]|uniref:type II toxin-antitoxin system RelE family toxin n=1 Tax=Candidatus Magnetobacterium casense TaxID=1455061 RepID=UPI00190F31FA